MRWLRTGQGEGMADDLAAMRRYARSLARDAHDADDVVQDALLRAMEGRRGFRAERGGRGWLLAIVHNVFVSGKRRAAAEARRNDRFAETLMSHVAPEQEQRARLTQIAQAFAELPEHHRSVLHLIAVEGLSYQETAQVLDVPIGTVMSRLARARSSLRADAAREPKDAGLRIVGGRDD